jgi:glycosyltransferase involved in cell wall biosynthesis
MTPGKVNVVIPVYNQEQYIGECIRSVLAQTYTNFDVTIIDDGSTDRSLAVAQEVSDEYTAEDRANRARYASLIQAGNLSPSQYEPLRLSIFTRPDRTQPVIVSRENKGLSASRNEGFRMGDGEFILPLDSDDWIDPRYLELTVPRMADPQVGIVSTDMQYEGLLHTRIPPKGLTLEHEMRSNDLPICSLIRREAFEQTKGYETLFVEVANSTKVLGYEDWEMWIQILKRGWKVAVVNEPLFHYRVKPVSMITQATKLHSGLVRLIHLLHPDLWK